MSQAHFDCQISASFDKLWKTLIDEAEHPNNYNPGITGCEILERFNDGLLRVVKVPDGEVREKVVFNYKNRSVRSSLVGHPSLVGVVTKNIEASDSTEERWTIRSVIEWESIDDRVDEMIRRNMEGFITTSLENVRKKAES